MKNARFFDEHQDRNRPCYAHICYPQNEEPYYFWEERFQIDKCCQYKGRVISEGIFYFVTFEANCITPYGVSLQLNSVWLG